MSIASSFIPSSTIVLRELRACEERGQALDRCAADVEVAEDARDVLLRRLRRAARQPVGGERPLEPRVGRDHRLARITLCPQVVERLVDDVREEERELGVVAPERSAAGPVRQYAAAMPAPARPTTISNGQIVNCGS